MKSIVFCDIIEIMGNTVGSLTQKQKSIITGSLLGDGSLQLQKGRSNAFLAFNHALAYKEYVDWKYKHLANLVGTPPKARKGNGKRMAYRFTTLSFPELTALYRKFYDGNKKIIPKDLILSPLALAVWFMDDGCKCRNSLYLNTQGFDLSDQNKLQEILRNQWSIDTTLNKDKKYYRIRIRAKDVDRFKKIVSPFILSLFYYKLV